jgi:hypothetical protein
MKIDTGNVILPQPASKLGQRSVAQLPAPAELSETLKDAAE